MKNNLFHNKSILITGATGSIGSAITEEILKYNWKINEIARSVNII